MPAEGPQQAARVRPEAGRLIAAGGQEALAVARPDHPQDFVVMTAEIAAETARAGLPKPHDAVADGQGQGQGRAVGAEGHRVDAVAEGPRSQQVALVRVPDEEAAVVHPGKHQAAVAGQDQGLRTRIVEPPEDAAVGRIADDDLAGVVAAGQPLAVGAHRQGDDRGLMIGNRPHGVGLADVRADDTGSGRRRRPTRRRWR